jgi:hypothetical protein
MEVEVLLIKSFFLVARTQTARYLNKGDIFLPDSTGWEFKVIKKVCFKLDGIYHIHVMVKPLSKGARKYVENKIWKNNENEK